MAEPISKDKLTQALKLKAAARMRQEQEVSGLSPEEWTARERSEWRWSSGPTRGLIQTAADIAGDFNAGIFGLLGDTVQDALAEVGMGRRSAENPLMGPVLGTGLEIAGDTTTLALGGGAALAGKLASRGAPMLADAGAQSIGALRAGAGLTQQEGILSRIGGQMGQAMEQAPGAMLGAEAMGGFGAGVGAGIAEQGGAPEMQGLAALAGGTAAGVVPVVGLNFTRQAMNWSLMHLAPWTESGGKLYAARRLQSLAGDPGKAAKRVKESNSGLSPARATQDKNLLALEARVLEEDPRMTEEFAQALVEARKIAQTQLRNEIGELRVPGEWERAVIEKAAIPGTVIAPGDTNKMLEQARKSFKPLYDEFKGYPVKTELETVNGPLPLGQVFKSSLIDPTLNASKSERLAAKRVLKDELSRITGASNKEEGTVDSSVLLTVRENLRDRISSLLATPDRGNHITARVLSNAEAALTQTLSQQLPEGAIGTMAQIDSQYRIFKVVEQAVYAAGDRPLSAQTLSQAVKSFAPPKQADSMRRMVRSGRNVETVIGKPDLAAKMVKGQDKATTSAVQNEFLDALWRKSLTNVASEDGEALVSGRRLLSALVNEKATAKALGISGERYTRMVNIAREIQAMEMKSPKALENLIEEGPTTIMQLFATLVGAKSGQRVAGHGMGSSLVLAGFFAKRARGVLGSVFGDKAQKILVAAHRDPELYAALLVKPTDTAKKQERAARVINAWLYPGAEFAAEDLEEGQE